jgi:hypothetical protein
MELWAWEQSHNGLAGKINCSFSMAYARNVFADFYFAS